MIADSSPGAPRAPFADLEADLRRLSERGRRRSLERSGGHDFSSNDYLAFADSVELREATRDAVDRRVPTGAGGSRLLRGNHPEHEMLEQAAATYFGADSALYFGSGYAANLTLFAAAGRSGGIRLLDPRQCARWIAPRPC